MVAKWLDEVQVKHLYSAIATVAHIDLMVVVSDTSRWIKLSIISPFLPNRFDHLTKSIELLHFVSTSYVHIAPTICGNPSGSSASNGGFPLDPMARTTCIALVIKHCVSILFSHKQFSIVTNCNEQRFHSLSDLYWCPQVSGRMLHKYLKCCNIQCCWLGLSAGDDPWL